MWNKKADGEKTYENMHIFFREEHLELDKVDALSKDESSLNQVAFMNKQEEVFENMEARLKINLVEAINDFAEKFQDQTSDEEESNGNATDVTSVLSTITGNTNKQHEKMMKLFEALSKKVEHIDAKCSGTPSNENNDTTGSNINPRTGRPYRRYCWTCGCCDHWGRNCPVRKPGHKINATFKNRMGGSTQGVLGA